MFNNVTKGIRHEKNLDSAGAFLVFEMIAISLLSWLLTTSFFVGLVTFAVSFIIFMKYPKVLKYVLHTLTVVWFLCTFILFLGLAEAAQESITMTGILGSLIGASLVTFVVYALHMYVLVDNGAYDDEYDDDDYYYDDEDDDDYYDDYDSPNRER